MTLTQRLFSLLTLSLAVAVFAAPVFASPAPPAVKKVWKYTKVPYVTTYCATERQLNDIMGHRDFFLGVSNKDMLQTWFSKKYVCDPLGHYAKHAYLTVGVEEALVTVGHEAAHQRGLRSERAAECAGIHFAYGYLHMQRMFRMYDSRSIALHLLNDSYRPSAYKVRGTCYVAGV